jgi:hypothetical protein
MWGGDQILKALGCGQKNESSNATLDMLLS